MCRRFISSNNDPVTPGDYIENKTAVMPADDPSEVVALYKQIKEIEFGEFMTP